MPTQVNEKEHALSKCMATRTCERIRGFFIIWSPSCTLINILRKDCGRNPNKFQTATIEVFDNDLLLQTVGYDGPEETI